MCGSQELIEYANLHLGLLFIDIKGSNMIKMVVNSFSAIPSYFVYHTLADINIVLLISR
jgi:hypothetical protein